MVNINLKSTSTIYVLIAKSDKNQYFYVKFPPTGFDFTYTTELSNATMYYTLTSAFAFSRIVQQREGCPCEAIAVKHTMFIPQDSLKAAFGSHN